MLQKNKLDRETMHRVLSMVIFIFLILQPIFDILSYQHTLGHIPFGISTYAKPLTVGLVNLALILVYKKQFWRCAATYGLFLIFFAVHLYLLMYDLQVALPTVLHEAKFLINLLYMLVMYHDLRILYQESPDNDLFTRKLARSLFLCFAIYVVLYLASVITGSSHLTYENVDHHKLGFKGWYQNGQIFAHALSITLPFLVYALLHNKAANPWLRLLGKLAVSLPVLVLCLVGTKVAYYIPIIVLAAQVVLEIFFAIRDKKRDCVWNAVICGVLAAACILAYPITPVYTNTYWNNHTLNEGIDTDRIVSVINDNEDSYKPSNEKDARWSNHAFSVLRGKYDRNELHPGDTRKVQMVFTTEKFQQADWYYKLFGLGYINQQHMAIERDVVAIFFCFGILGFLLFLLRPIWLWLKSAFTILRKLFKTDMLTLCLFEGFSMFFFISCFAGYTFIYPHFSIFLVIGMCLLTHQIQKLKHTDGKLSS